VSQKECQSHLNDSSVNTNINAPLNNILFTACYVLFTACCVLFTTCYVLFRSEKPPLGLKILHVVNKILLLINVFAFLMTSLHLNLYTAMFAFLMTSLHLNLYTAM